jgi:hypothetical protein
MISPNTLFIGWNRPVPGREGAAGELFAAMQNLFGNLKNNGKIDSFEPCFLSQHGGDMNGFWIVKGEESQLHDLRKNDDFYKIVMQCGSVLQGFGVIDAYSGKALENIMQDWMKLVAAK